MEEEQIYEELENERLFNQKNRNGKSFFFVLLFIILFGVGCYFFLKNNLDKEKKREEMNQPIIKEQEGYQTQFECEDKCTYDLELTNGKIAVTYEKIKNEDYTYTDKVTIGSTVISNKSHLCGGPATLGVLEDIILISYHDGCDIGGNTLYAYTFNLWLANTNYKIKDNKIIVDATRLYHGNTLKLDTEKEVNLCEETEWSLYNIHEDTLVIGTYEIEYEGKGTFKEPKLINEKKVKDVLNICEKV